MSCPGSQLRITRTVFSHIPKLRQCQRLRLTVRDHGTVISLSPRRNSQLLFINCSTFFAYNVRPKLIAVHTAEQDDS